MKRSCMLVPGFTKQIKIKIRSIIIYLMRTVLNEYKATVVEELYSKRYNCCMHWQEEMRGNGTFIIWNTFPPLFMYSWVYVWIKCEGNNYSSLVSFKKDVGGMRGGGRDRNAHVMLGSFKKCQDVPLFC